MDVSVPPASNTYTLFLSSADDEWTQKLRSRVKRLIDDVINPRLGGYREAGVRLALDMWEREAAQRASPGRKVNDLFVEKAKDSQLTLVLLLDEIRPGTREELDAALAQLGVQVALLIFERPNGPLDAQKFQELNDYIDALRARDDLFYDSRCGEPDSDDAWLSLIRTLLDFTFGAMRNHDPRNVALNAEVR
jgi:hypothetical protein